MPVEVLHVCDKFGVKGSSIHGVSRLFSWWFPRYDSARFQVSLCGLKKPEPASQLLASQGIPVHHLGRRRFDPRILTDLVGLAEDALVVGTVSRLSHQKGHRFLIDAAASVLGHRPEVRFLIAGDGDLMDSLKAQARELGIASHVVFAGHRTDVPDVLGAIDVLAISSLYEGTPLALFESMPPGKAIVSTAVDGCREVLTDGVTGLLVPPGDAPALADGLLTVLGDPALLASLAAQAREASRRYDVRACVDQMEAPYDELLAEAGAGCRPARG